MSNEISRANAAKKLLFDTHAQVSYDDGLENHQRAVEMRLALTIIRQQEELVEKQHGRDQHGIIFE